MYVSYHACTLFLLHNSMYLLISCFQLFLRSVSLDEFCLLRSHHIVSQYSNLVHGKVESPRIVSEANINICDSAPAHVTATCVATAPVLKTIESNNVPVIKKRSREEVESEAFKCGAEKGG
jgi:hypothetical protein